MTDLVLFVISGILLLIVFIAFCIGLGFTTKDPVNDYVYFKYSYLYNAVNNSDVIIRDNVCYVKCCKQYLHGYRALKIDSDFSNGHGKRNLAHITWISRREYEKATK